MTSNARIDSLQRAHDDLDLASLQRAPGEDWGPTHLEERGGPTELFLPHLALPCPTPYCDGHGELKVETRPARFNRGWRIDIYFLCHTCLWRSDKRGAKSSTADTIASALFRLKMWYLSANP